MKRTIKAVIFDQDGLMFDTERVSVVAWKRAQAEFGITLEEDFLMTIRGMNVKSAALRFREVFGDSVDFMAFRERKQACHRELLEETGLPVKLGLKELLAYLKQAGCPMAVASASALPYTEKNLCEAGVREYFDHLVTGDMVSEAKPNPEIFLKAAELLGVEPEHCLVLEDSLNGVEAGLQGGFITVMIPDLTQPDEALRGRVHGVCRSLLELRDILETGEMSI